MELEAPSPPRASRSLRGDVGRRGPVRGHVLRAGALPLHGCGEGGGRLVGWRVGVLVPQRRVLPDGVLVERRGLRHALVGVLRGGQRGFLLLEDEGHAGGRRRLGVVQLVGEDDGHAFLYEGGLVFDGQLPFPLLAVADHGDDAGHEEDGGHHHGRDDGVQVHVVLAALLRVFARRHRRRHLRDHPSVLCHGDELDVPAAAGADHRHVQRLELRLQDVGESQARPAGVIRNFFAQSPNLLPGTGLQGQRVVCPLHYDGAFGDVLHCDGAAVPVAECQSQLLHQHDLLIDVIHHCVVVPFQPGLELHRRLVSMRAFVDVDFKGIHSKKPAFVGRVHEVLVLPDVVVVRHAVHELAGAVELHPRILLYHLLLLQLQGQLQFVSGGIFLVVESI